MLIDWFTFTAQLINFIVLIWLLKRYLYQPVLAALDEREKLIAGQINDAIVKEKQAEEERALYQNKIGDFEQKRSQLLSDAQTEAKARREELIDKARQESEELRERYTRSLETEQQQIKGHIMKRATREVFAVSRQTLNDLAGLSLEEQIFEVFINKLDTQEKSEKEQMRAAFSSSAHPLIKVHSSFEVSTSLQTRLQKALAEYTPAGTRYEFVLSPELINGLELRSDDYKVSWNINEYLTTLENNIVASIQDSLA